MLLDHYGSENLNEYFFNDRTLLMIACNEGFFDIVKMLIERGADVNIILDSGTSALKIAKFKGHEQIVNLLLENGACFE